MNEDKKHRDSLEKDLRAYKKLKQIGDSPELDAYFDLLLKTVGEKMMWAFTGDNVKSWDDFLKVRGEVVAFLYPIQEVRGADAMQEHLQTQLDNYYGKNI